MLLLVYTKSQISFDIDTPTWKSYLDPTHLPTLNSNVQKLCSKSRMIFISPCAPRGVIGFSFYATFLPWMFHGKSIHIKIQCLWRIMQSCLRFKASWNLHSCRLQEKTFKLSGLEWKERKIFCLREIEIAFGFISFLSLSWNLVLNRNIVMGRLFLCYLYFIVGDSFFRQDGHPTHTLDLFHLALVFSSCLGLHPCLDPWCGQAYKSSEGFGGLKSLQSGCACMEGGAGWG